MDGILFMIFLLLYVMLKYFLNLFDEFLVYIFMVFNFMAEAFCHFSLDCFFRYLFIF